MKTFLCSLFCACLLKILVFSNLWDSDGYIDRELSTSAWVQSSCAMFDIRTHQDKKGDLIVQINNRSGRDLTVTLQTERGEEVAYVPVSQRQGVVTIKLDVSKTPSGSYRVAVTADTEKAVQLVKL